MELKKAIYTIEEAAKLLACRPEQLITKMIAEKLELYVHTPENLDIYNLGRSEVRRPDLKYTVGQRRSSTGPKSHRVSDIDFLVIPNVGLHQLLKSELYMGSVFSLGGTIDKDGDVAIVRPSTPDFHGACFGVDTYLRHFVTFRSGINDLYTHDLIKHPQKFKITQSDILVARADLKILLTKDEPEIGSPLGIPTLDVQPYPGKHLAYLHDVFCKTWERWGTDDFEEPQSRAIFDVLLKEFDSENLAELGVRVILKDVVPERKNDLRGPRIVAVMMKQLIDGSVAHWTLEPDGTLPNPLNGDVSKWFEGKGWSKSAARAAATMIRPSAPKGRKPVM